MNTDTKNELLKDTSMVYAKYKMIKHGGYEMSFQRDEVLMI